MDAVMVDSDAQALYMNAMLSNHELFAKVNNLIKPSYFDPQFQGGIKFMQEYFQENRVIPATSIFSVSTKLPTMNVTVQKEDIDFLAVQIAKFCQLQAVIDAIRKSPELIESRDYGTLLKQIKEASEIELVSDFGIDYFDDPLARLEAAEALDVLISTGWKDVDEVLDGGIGRQELITVLAPSGGGKSVTMLNLAYNLLSQGLNGVYISLEMADRKVALRTDQIIARIASKMVNMNKAQVAHEIQLFQERSNSQFFIKRMREGITTPNSINAYLRELKSKKNFHPDFIVCDYLDILEPDQKKGVDSMFTKDKYTSQELRALGFDYDAVVITASQLEKSATEKILEGKSMNQSNVQGGSSKTNTSDLMIAAVKTDAMHAAGEYRFEFPKARNSGASGKQVMLKWDPQSLRISDMNSIDFKPKPNLNMSSVIPGKATKSVDQLVSGLNF